MSNSSLFRGTAIVSGLTFLSRILGFIRDLLIARLFGATATADIFFVAFRIPNTLRQFVAEGAFTSAFIPVLADQREEGEEAGKQFVLQAFSGLLLVTLLLTVLGYFFAPYVVAFFAPGFIEEPEKLSRTAHLLIIMLPYIPSISLVVLMNGVLTTLRFYGAGAMAQIAVNGCLIAGTILAGSAPHELQAEYLAWAVFVAAFVQFGLLSFFSARIGYPVKLQWPTLSAPVKQMLLLMVPALLGAAVYQLSILINTALASLLPSGSISWLVYADRLSQLPIGVYTIALTSVLLPHLAESQASKDYAAVQEKLINALRFSIYLLVPLAVGMSTLALPLVQLVFERGAFTTEDSIQASRALSVYALGLVPFSLYTIFSRHLIAQQKPIIPALIGLFAITISCVIALATMGSITDAAQAGWFGSIVTSAQGMLPSGPELAHVGLALASVSASVISLFCYLWFVVRRERMDLSILIPLLAKSCFGGVVLWGICQAIIGMELSPATTICSAGAAGLLGYLVVTWLLQTKELQETIKATKQLRR